MKILNVEQIEDFIDAVDKCSGEVWLESPYGDKFNLKSKLSQYIALGELLGEHGQDMELFCGNVEDQHFFFQFFAKHPEVNGHKN